MDNAERTIAILKRILVKGAKGEKDRPYYWAETCSEVLVLLADIESEIILGPEEVEYEETEEEVSE